MQEESEKQPEVIEAESGLARTQREIEAVEKDLLSLREKLRVAEQKEVNVRTEAGKDGTDFEPTPEMNTFLTSVTKAESSLGLLKLRSEEQKKRIEELKRGFLDKELVALSRVILSLKNREAEISKELELVQNELQVAEKRSAELAEKIATTSEGEE